MQLQDGAASPNAQLRALNPHVGSTLGRRAVCILPNRVCQLNASPEHELCGGVSSFGYADKQCRDILVYLEDDCGISWEDWGSFFRQLTDEEVREIAVDALGD